MSFKPYPKYKESGVAWAGRLPAHWSTSKLKNIFDLMRREPEDGDEIVTAFRDGEVTLRTNRRVDGFTQALQEHGYQRVLPGDLVIHAMDAFAGAIGVSDSTGKSTPVYSVCRARMPHTCVNYYGRLLRHMALSEFIQSLAKGIRERSSEFRWKDASQVVVPEPPPKEQATIAAFLDHETAKLDALIAEQQRLIDLLQEKRQAVISHAVTKGLNLDAPMKDSGIEWLGEVPEHWAAMTVRRLLARVEQGWSPECFAHPADNDEWGVVKAGCVNRGVFNETDNKALPGSLAPLPEYEIQAGDLLMSRASGSPELVGSTAYVEQVRPRLMLSDKIFRLHPAPIVTRRYFALLFNAPVMRLQIERAISGAEGLANNLPQSALKSFVCVMPPIDEQQVIVSYVSSRLEEFGQLSAEALHAITLLQERRSALISAAVTGQIDVRNFSGEGAAA